MKKSFYCISIILLLTNFLNGQRDIVHGNLIQFNDNGLWCWFQDERAIIDIENWKLILGSSASRGGVGYNARNGVNEAVIFDLLNGQSTRYYLGTLSADDHNAPAFLKRPDGKYITMYSDHYDHYKNRYRIFDGTAWSPEQAYDWELKPGGTDYTIAYNNMYYLSSEGRMYNFSRANHRSPNFIISDDMGDTWTFGGQLTTNTSNSYNKGYYKYWSNGIDRIDFLFTEQHPRDTLTSIYHGYIKGGKTYDSFDNLVDDDIYDESFISAFWNYTKVFSNGTTIGDKTLYRCWQSDLIRYDDETIAAIITARTNQFESPGYPDNSINPHHDFIYCRFDGTAWSYTYLGKAGLKFYSSEADYVGLGALAPNDANLLYISTPYDPRDSTINLGVREIFKGVTSDNGNNWTWTPVTENSVRDNVRPIIPAWDENNLAVLWCRGTYSTAQSFDAAIVGIIEKKSEPIDPFIYVDASTLNTTFANGAILTATGPDANTGASDNQWHQRTGVGNNGSIFTSSELSSGENAPLIKTQIDLPGGETYDVWINFWAYANTSANWRIKAGLSPGNMQLFRSMASKQVEAADYQTSPLLSAGSDIYLYQAYLGRVSGVRSFDVFIDDSAYQVGTSNAVLQGDGNRTWYDGISYAKVDDSNVPVELSSFTAKIILNGVELKWQTESELNNYGFEVEKNINDTWFTIGFVKGFGTTTESNLYTFIDKNMFNKKIKYRLKQIDIDGSVKYSNTVEVDAVFISEYELAQNYPNPFNPVTHISFKVPYDSNVKLEVISSLGEIVEVLVNEFKPAGIYNLEFDASEYSSGIYIYRLTSGSMALNKKMILMK